MDTAPTRNAAERERPTVEEADLPSAGKAAGTALAGAAAACLLLLLLASAVGADFGVIRTDGRDVAVTFSSVVVTLMLVGLVGTVLLATVGRRSRRAWTAVAVAGLALAVVSIALPLMSTAGPLMTAILVAMHLVSGVIWCAVLIWKLPRR